MKAKEAQELLRQREELNKKKEEELKKMQQGVQAAQGRASQYHRT